MFTGDEVKSQDDKDPEDGESSRIFVFLDKVVATKLVSSCIGVC
jgi:hypothetical protein